MLQKSNIFPIYNFISIRMAWTVNLYSIPIQIIVKYIIYSNIYFKAIANYLKHQYQLEVDPSGKDVSRACFLPHDAEAFINPKYL